MKGICRVLQGVGIWGLEFRAQGGVREVSFSLGLDVVLQGLLLWLHKLESLTPCWRASVFLQPSGMQ